MTQLERGMIIDVNLDPTQCTKWNPKKSRILTNIEIEACMTNGSSKHSIADCLQTRPIDHRCRLVKVRGMLEVEFLNQLNQTLKVVFALE